MIKKIDYYILKIFINLFIVIFSIIFFIFIIQFFWSNINNFMNKGLKIITVIQVIFYFSLSLVPFIIPISILLTSIMTYGKLSENYELLAIKSIGISLWRMMRFLFILNIFMAIGLFLFSNYIIPASYKKAKNIVYNVSLYNPSKNITSGNFINISPNIIIKIEKKIEGKKNFLKGIFIRQNKDSSKEENTILAEKGKLILNKDSQYLEIYLINGILYSENKNNYQNIENYKNTYKIIEFKTFLERLNISKLINQNTYDDNYEDNYNILSIQKLKNKIKIIKDNNKKIYKEILRKKYLIKVKKFSNNKNTKKNKNKLYNFSKEIKNKKKLIKKNLEYLIKYEIEFHKKFSFPISCILMFLIGAPLGAIIQKGSIGIPILISLIIFIFYFILLNINQNLSEIGKIPIWLGSWLSNLIVLPISILLITKTMKN